jgi:iron complex outermembrane recepter protein
VSPITNGNGGVIPRWHHYATLSYSKSSWDAAISENFQSSYRDLLGTLEDNTVPGFVERDVGSYSTVDLQVAYSGIRSLKMAVGLRNAFNKSPPYTNAGGQNYFQAGYDPGYVDPRGRFLYGFLTYAFAPGK